MFASKVLKFQTTTPLQRGSGHKKDIKDMEMRQRKHDRELFLKEKRGEAKTFKGALINVIRF
jgi:hypothetical protein